MSKTKTSKRKNSHRVPFYRRPWAIVIFFLIMAIAVVLALIFIRPQPASESDESATDQPVDNSAAIPSGEGTEPTTPAESDEPEKTTQYEGEDPNTLEQLTGYLTRKGVDDGVLTVVAVIDQYLHTPGFCTITLKNSTGQTVYTASSDAIPDVTASICDTFEIPTTGFASGTYRIEIDLASDNKRGIITDEVNL